MDYPTPQISWTEEQWNRVRQVVTDEAQKARVAAQFLPLFGPVDPSTVAIPNLQLQYPVNPSPPPSLLPAPTGRIVVDSSPTTFLATISVQVHLQNHDIADPEMASALTSFRRAANILARLEDAYVFSGQPGRGLVPNAVWRTLGLANEPPPGWLLGMPLVYQVTGGAKTPGLLGFPVGNQFTVAAPSGGAPINFGNWGNNLVTHVVQAINGLEANGYFGPFAFVMAPNMFQAVCTPTANLVLPRDRILPFLEGGPLLRTAAIPDGFGVVVALGGSPVELVVGTDCSVRLLEVSLEPRYVFRVAERIALRIKDDRAIALLQP